MTIATVSSQDLDRDADRAKQAADKEPVFITEDGVPAYVLLSFEQYRRLVAGLPSSAGHTGSPCRPDKG